MGVAGYVLIESVSPPDLYILSVRMNGVQCRAVRGFQGSMVSRGRSFARVSARGCEVHVVCTGTVAWIATEKRAGLGAWLVYADCAFLLCTDTYSAGEMFVDVVVRAMKMDVEECWVHITCSTYGNETNDVISLELWTFYLNGQDSQIAIGN